jgi:hypothetical protein
VSAGRNPKPDHGIAAMDGDAALITKRESQGWGVGFELASQCTQKLIIPWAPMAHRPIPLGKQ